MEDRDELELRRAFETLELQEPPAHVHAGDIIYAGRLEVRRRRLRRSVVATLLGIAVLPTAAGIATATSLQGSEVVVAKPAPDAPLPPTTSRAERQMDTDFAAATDAEPFIHYGGLHLGRRQAVSQVVVTSAATYVTRRGPGHEFPVVEEGVRPSTGLALQIGCYLVLSDQPVSYETNPDELWLLLQAAGPLEWVNVQYLEHTDGVIPECPAGYHP